MNKQQQRSSSSSGNKSGSRPEHASEAFVLSLSLSRACHTLWLGKYCIHNDYNARQFSLVSSMPITSANRRRGRWQRLPLASCRLSLATQLATQLVALSFWRPLAVTLTCCRLRSPGELEHATAEPNSRRLVCPTYAACGSNKCNGNNNTAPLPPRASRPLPAGGSWRLAASCDPHLSRSLAEFAFQGYVEQVLRQRRRKGNGNGNGTGVDL